LPDKKFIFGNWKMAQSLASARGFIEAWNAAKSDGVEVAIFPSYVHLPLVADLISRQAKPLKFGAQDCSTEEKGAFTGEISAGMIAELKSSYVLIGHSEQQSDSVFARYHPASVRNTSASSAVTRKNTPSTLRPTRARRGFPSAQHPCSSGVMPLSAEASQVSQ
jgi:hypothetical protein